MFTPPELRNILELNFDLFDIHLNYPIEYHELDGNRSALLYEDKWLTVESFTVKHRIPTSGFLFKEKERPRKLLKDKIEQYRVPISERMKIKNGADFIGENGAIVPNEELTADPPGNYAFAY